MPPSKITKNDGSFGESSSLQELAKEREILDTTEMLYQDFERNIEELEARGVTLPPLTDEYGRPVSIPQEEMTRIASISNRNSGMMPISKNEQAVISLMEIRDDMLKQYGAIRDSSQAITAAMHIQKLEAQIISMGGDVERFSPEKYQSGLKPVDQAIDQFEAAKKVVANTKKAYALHEIKKIWAGKNKSGKIGICIQIDNESDTIVQGTVYPKNIFSGLEVVDYVPSSNGNGLMTVKVVDNGFWKDVSSDFDIAWRIIKEQ